VEQLLRWGRGRRSRPKRPPVVAVSINIQRIIEYPTLPTRAGQTLIVFVVPLVLGVLVLIPDQPRAALGAELIAVGALTGVILLRTNRPSNRSDKEPRIAWLLTRFLPSLAISVLVTVAGISMVVKTGGGLYSIAPATILALVTA
jgi:hypothetical protein